MPDLSLAGPSLDVDSLYFTSICAIMWLCWYATGYPVAIKHKHFTNTTAPGGRVAAQQTLLLRGVFCYD